jgi:hypothetical protein
MPGIEAKVIQELDDQIVALKETIEKAGSEARDNLKSINVEEARKAVPRDAAGKLDETGWAALKDKQQEVHHRLSLIYESLRAVAGLDGPRDPHHMMFDDYASNTAIVCLTIVSFGFMVLLLCTVIRQWNQATGTDLSRKIQATKPALVELDAARKKVEEAKAVKKDEENVAASGQTEKTLQEAQKMVDAMTAKQAEAEKKVADAIQAIPKDGATEGSILTMVVLLGALGGSLHLISSLFKYVGNRQLKRSWILYYLAMPLTGAGLAPIVYMLLRVGIINPSGVSSDGSNIANLNLMAIYAFALLTGMFSRAAADKLGEVFGTVFRTSSAPSKDVLGSKKPPEGAAPGAGKSP